MDDYILLFTNAMDDGVVSCRYISLHLERARLNNNVEVCTIVNKTTTKKKRQPRQRQNHGGLSFFVI